MSEKKPLEDRLNESPELRARVESMLDIVENTHGDYEKADDAEMKAIETLNGMGSDLLAKWALNQEKKHGNKAEDELGRPHEKKT